MNVVDLLERGMERGMERGKERGCGFRGFKDLLWHGGSSSRG